MESFLEACMTRFCSILVLLFLVSIASAQVPRKISFQGVLTDTLGNPRPDGPYSLTFRIYNASTGNSPLWTEARTVSVKRGLLSVLLGDTAPIPDSLKFDRPYWLGIQLGSSAELSPRTELTAVGYSFRSVRADTAQFAKDIAPGTVVRVVNGITDEVTLVPGSNVSINAIGNTLRISAGGGGGSLKFPLADTSASDEAVLALTNTGYGGAVSGEAKQGGIGVFGLSNYIGVSGFSSGGTGVQGGGPTRGAYGLSDLGTGVEGGHTLQSGISPGVYGWSGSQQASAIGILGELTSTSPGGSSAAVKGLNRGTGASGIGVWGEHAGSGYGVYGISPSGIGVYGITTTGTAVYGSSSDGSIGRLAGGGTGVYGSSTNNAGAYGSSTNGPGVYGVSTFASGVYGTNGSTTGRGVTGINTGSGYGVHATSATGTGLYAAVTGSASGNAVFAQNTVSGAYGFMSGEYVVGPTLIYTCGVYGNPGPGSDDTRWVGVYGKANSPNQRAGYFDGNVAIAGDLTVGGKKNFMIDHPLDPLNKYLVHSCVESNEMMNVYSGNILTDGEGLATVELPTYFESLNQDFRYQLTVIGQFAQAIIMKEIDSNRFEVKTDKPNVKVSWQVTGIRHDAYAISHPMKNEVMKEPAARGKYVNPDAFGVRSDSSPEGGSR